MIDQNAVDASNWIVVVGRSNFAKASHSMQQMIRDLQSDGFAVHTFETRKVQRSQRISAWLQALWGGVVVRWSARYHHRRWLQKCFKAAWLLMHPSQWDFSRLKGLTANDVAATELCQLLQSWHQQWPQRWINVLAHSAGGIVACRVEDQPNLRRVVCFGYPFKHPQHGEEPFRTSHLQHMSKPVLMIQGLRDEYGNAQQAQRSYKLSDSIRLVDIDADHNCDDLTAGEYQRTLQQVVEFFKESGSDPDCFVVLDFFGIRDLLCLAKNRPHEPRQHIR